MQVIEYLKKIGSFLLAIIIICLFIVPYVLFLVYLKKNDKTVDVYPEFKIKDIQGNEDVDQELLKKSVSSAQDILKKIRGK